MSAKRTKATTKAPAPPPTPDPPGFALRARSPLSPVSMLSFLLGEDADVALLLPLADAELPALLDASSRTGVPLHHDAIAPSVARLAAQHTASHATVAAQYEAGQAAGQGIAADVADRIIDERTDAAFALGMALGLRLGGAR
jgi:hypothetical protein